MSKSARIKSDTESAVWLRVVAPFMFLVDPILIRQESPNVARGFCASSDSTGCFLSSLATIEVADGRMRYRRFVTCRNLDQEEIRDSGKSSVLIGDIGYLQLNHYLAP